MLKNFNEYISELKQINVEELDKKLKDLILEILNKKEKATFNMIYNYVTSKQIEDVSTLDDILQEMIKNNEIFKSGSFYIIQVKTF